jgi:hypothetical protein
MKRSNVLAYAAMLALPAFAACRSELSEAPTGEANPAGVAIEFTSRQASGGMARSAGDLTTDNLAAMTVYAHNTGTESFASSVGSTTPNFMLNQRVAKADGAWTYSPVKYWLVQDEKISFFAISPAPGTGGIAARGSYTGYPSFTVTPPAAPAQQQDICVASAIDRTRDDGKVPFHFAHAMAKVSFAARYKGSMPVAGGAVKVTQFWLAQVVNSGTLRLNDTSFTWSVTEYSKSNYYLSAANGDLLDSALLAENAPGSSPIFTNNGTLLLVPQTVSANTTVQLLATLYDGAGAAVSEYRLTAALPPTAWEAGKQATYTLLIDLDKEASRWSYSFTGEAQAFTAPQDGAYRLEAWGAQGHNGGSGGYAAGEVNLKAGTTLHVFVGGNRHTFNGGGNQDASYGARMSKGGGATDFRLTGGAWNNAISLNSRILVAGGGGGQGGANSGYGGGLTGQRAIGGYTLTSYIGSYGGTQVAGGAVVVQSPWGGGGYGSAGRFGVGGGGASYAAGGGGGYYGGGGGMDATTYTSGGGGSSFISGFAGCVAIDPTDVTSNPRTQDTASTNVAALNYSSALFGASPTWSDGEEITFANPAMVDGAGYEWVGGAKATAAIGMPDPSGGGSITGKQNNGYARITLLQAN